MSALVGAVSARWEDVAAARQVCATSKLVPFERACKTSQMADEEVQRSRVCDWEGNGSGNVEFFLSKKKEK